MWQPKIQSYGGTLDIPFNMDSGLLWHGRMSEDAANVGGFNWELNNYVSSGLFGGPDIPVNVDAIQHRIQDMQYRIASGGSLVGIGGDDHHALSGSLALAAKQFSAPDYSAAPDLQAGEVVDGFSVASSATTPVQATPVYDFSMPEGFTNAFSDMPYTRGLSTASENLNIAHAVSGAHESGVLESALEQAMPPVLAITPMQAQDTAIGSMLSHDSRNLVAGLGVKLKMYDLALDTGFGGSHQVSTPMVPNLTTGMGHSINSL
jgi:hypothetical protein